MSEYQTIEFEQSGPVARIVLNRPEAANGMNHTMPRELADAGRRCDTGTTKVVVLAAESLEEQMEAEGRLIAMCADSADGREGVDAFLAKRRPQFS